MNQFLKRFLSVAALASFSMISARTFIPRSAGSDIARWQMAQAPWINIPSDDCSNLWYDSLVVQYGQSFNNGNIARVILDDAVTCVDNGCDTTASCNAPCATTCSTDCSTNGGALLNIQGSRVTSRDANAWLADYFGLAPDYSSVVTINPKIQQVVIDLGWYVGWDRVCDGLFFRLQAPLAWSKWNLCMNETVNTNTQGYVKGYFGPNAVANSSLVGSFKEFMQGETPDLGGTVAFDALRFARLAVPSCLNNEGLANGDSNSSSAFRLADLRAIIGWNAIVDYDYHFGIGLEAAAPTGTKHNAAYVFAPVVGNNRHWELGAYITGHYTFWRSECETKSFGLYLDANITHLFANTQQRTFDLVGKPNSKYMLAMQLATDENTTAIHPVTTTDVNGNPSINAFADHFTSVANLTTRNVEVRINAQADVGLMANLQLKRWGFDLGYNLWVRGCERMSCTPCTPTCLAPVASSLNSGEWALKGDASVYGFFIDPNNTNVVPVRLPVSENAATIHTGTNGFSGPTGEITATTINGVSYYPMQNPGVDNRVTASSTNIVAAATARSVFFSRAAATAGGGVGTTGLTNISVYPVTITEADIDYTSDSTRGLTNAVFGDINYNFPLCCLDAQMFLAVGGKGEWAQGGRCNSTCSTTNSCFTSSICGSSTNGCAPCGDDSCVKGALSQWNVYFKAGISF